MNDDLNSKNEQSEKKYDDQYILKSGEISNFDNHKEQNIKKTDTGMKKIIYVFFIMAVALAVFFTSVLFMPNVRKNLLSNIFSNKNNNLAANNGINEFGPTIDLVDKKEAENVMTAQDIYKKVVPSIVGIVTYNPSKGLSSTSAGQGSGIIMSQDGYIITNAHVIGNSNKYNVTVVVGEKEYSAKVVGFDIRTDLAVLKIDATGLIAAEFGNSDQIEVGEWVLALGNPGGLEFSNSLTRGLVSAKDRSLGASNSPVKYIQTDAPINPGNSGGALLNMHGQVVGINCAKVSEFEGMGFAIPINTVKTVVDDIIKRGYVSGRVRLGVSVRPISAYEAQMNDVPQGLLISEISDDSNVTSSGIKVGDIITKIDGTATTTTSSLYAELSKHKPGDVINLTVYRLPAASYAQNRSQGSSFDARVSLIEDKGQNQ